MCALKKLYFTLYIYTEKEACIDHEKKLFASYIYTRRVPYEDSGSAIL